MAAAAHQMTNRFPHSSRPFVVHAMRRGGDPKPVTMLEFAACANLLLDEFQQRADSLAGRMEAGGHMSLAQFERCWNELQAWLCAQIAQLRPQRFRRASQRGIGRDSASLAETTLALDRVRSRIDRVLLNTNDVASAALLKLRAACTYASDMRAAAGMAMPFSVVN